MEITLRDVIYLLVFLGSIGGVYAGLLQRLTRLEAIVHRVEKVEGAVGELRAEGSKTSRELGALQAEFSARGLRDRRAQP